MDIIKAQLQEASIKTEINHCAFPVIADFGVALLLQSKRERSVAEKENTSISCEFTPFDTRLSESQADLLLGLFVSLLTEFSEELERNISDVHRVPLQDAVVNPSSAGIPKDFQELDDLTHNQRIQSLLERISVTRISINLPRISFSALFRDGAR